MTADTLRVGWSGKLIIVGDDIEVAVFHEGVHFTVCVALPFVVTAAVAVFFEIPFRGIDVFAAEFVVPDQRPAVTRANHRLLVSGPCVIGA